VLKLFVLVEEFDRNMAVFFLQDSCATLVQRLDFVDDYVTKSAVAMVHGSQYLRAFGSGEATPPDQA
jgi:hypothetical protein